MSSKAFCCEASDVKNLIENRWQEAINPNTSAVGWARHEESFLFKDDTLWYNIFLSQAMPIGSRKEHVHSTRTPKSSPRSGTEL